MKVAFKKYRDETWDFQTANTKQYTHCFHTYLAMMILQVSRRILDKFGKGSALLFDPYCGTGTSLVEANLKGINAVGTDINPLARLIAKVKTTVIPVELLDSQLKDFNDFVLSIRLGGKRIHPKIPKFKNIDYWFKKETQYQIAAVKVYIDEIKDKDIQDFFKVAFSETVREVSLTRNNEFKLYRMSEEQIEAFNPNVFSIMITKLIRNINGMAYIVITSPPYGDSRTTVAYGQFSRLSNQWFFGGNKTKEVISKIADIDRNRAL